MKTNDQFTDWAVALQSVAQNGLKYGKDVFDRERYQQVREIAAQMMAAKTGLPLEKIRTLFCGDEGYQTPKIETRAAIIKDGQILLVHEKLSDDWALPGGWCEANLSTMENCIKEAKEESGRDVQPIKLIALQDRNKHNSPIRATGIMKAFYLCKVLGGEFEANSETSDCRYFSLDNLPQLSLDRNTPEQIKMCFAAAQDPNWQTKFD
ncbi:MULTISPECIES: NUDIX hydrolase [Lactobacillus]|uniref:NUDIX domain-containing protein n=1 Tax=Lactobacillus xujianguonis TaxID=2495899 RepID=A0A437SU64_9LACO|nr:MULTISPECIES: NUDIX hydrolase [Lactobacillus]RVU70402.1 NUDIX domain-containing protein [Lactobacillus xujianguonis]RVU73649.1 NUDIX domain-containing protein [Lactobacillus xujianguonis]